MSDTIKPVEFKGHVPFAIGDQMYSNARLEMFADHVDLNNCFGPDGHLYGCLIPQILHVDENGAILAVVAQKLDEDALAVMNERSKLIDEEVNKRVNARKEREAAEEAKKKEEERELRKLADLGREVRKKISEAEALPDAKDRQALKKQIALAKEPAIREMAETMVDQLSFTAAQHEALMTRLGQVIGGAINDFCIEQAKLEGKAE